MFSIPFFRNVREPARRLEPDEQLGTNPLRVAGQRLRETFRELRGYRQAVLLLMAFLFYSDGISTIYRMAAIYGTEIGIEQHWVMASILLVQFVGVPFAILNRASRTLTRLSPAPWAFAGRIEWSARRTAHRRAIPRAYSSHRPSEVSARRRHCA